MESNFLTLLLALVLVSGAHATGSCREAGRCCDGRDPSCSTATSGGGERPCYCDHACLQVGDCCPDFQDFCGAADCEVSSWGSWSECSAACGPGTMARERRVARPPRSGGKPCPELVQRRSCSGAGCDGTPHHGRETAMVLPASYSSNRQVNTSEDIRSNLRLRYTKNPGDSPSKEYCVIFEITRVSKFCKNMTTGQQVCVACETAAMRKHLGYQCQGQGSEQTNTHFTLLTLSPCHGTWKHQRIDENCHDCKTPHFIFV